MLWDGTVRWAVPALVVPAAEGEKNIARKRGLSMKLFRRGLALLLALSVLGAVTLASAAELPDDLEGAVVIIHTNDVHGSVDGYAKAAAMKTAYEAYGAYVLLLDAGDYSGGAPTVDLTSGASAIELMNAAGYDAAAIGESELGWGYEEAQSLAGSADFPLLSANVRYEGETAFSASKIFEAPDGTKIGVFALTPPAAQTAAGDRELTVLSGNELAACAQEQADALNAAGCDLVVCMGHLGINDSTDSSIRLLQQVSGIDVMIDGRSHSTVEEIEAANGGTCIVGETTLTSTGANFENVGLVVYKDGDYVAMTLPIDEVVLSDETVAALAAEIQRIADGGGSVAGYRDVLANSWYADAVSYVTEAGLMEGSGGLFQPNSPMTRAMLVTVLYRLSGSPEVTGSSPFTDVAESAWYADAVIWAAGEGIVQGQTADTFAPNGAVTREQLATFLFRYDGGEGSGSLDAYTDANTVSAYAAEAMGWAVGEGLITGTGAGTLSPKTTASRAMVAALLMRYTDGEV